MCKIKIYFFDFDSTLVENHYPWEPYENEEDNDYMESTKSLEHDFELKQSTLERYNEAKEDVDSILVLLTNRTHKLKKEILALLEERGIIFDYHLLRKKDRSKGNRMENFIKEFETDSFIKVDEVFFFDDKVKHIQDVLRITENFKDIQFQLNKVA